MYPKSIVVSSLLLLFSSLFNLSSSTELCNPHDKQVLLQMKESFGNPDAMYFWHNDTDCCFKWVDTSCDDEGHVTNLVISMLSEDQFHGEFPASICELPYLQYLLIATLPYIVGPLPPCFANITTLRSITILGTNLTGPIFPYLVQNKNLSSIRLEGNAFPSHIPNSLGDLVNLESLELSGEFSGRIPDRLFDKLQKLQVVNIHDTMFRGEIPKSLGSLPNLKQLVLTNCRFSGKIPETFCNSNITQLDLSFNRLKGDPTKTLFCKNNTAIQSINLKNNSLSFDFTNSTDPPKSLTSLDLSHNMIYGSLPKRLGQWHYLKTIDVSYNQLCGRIPSGRRLNQMSPDYFSNNKCLCGRPLPPCTP